MFIVINPANQSVVAVQATASEDEIKTAIGFATIDFDEINREGDRLYFDERCFIRKTPGAKRFQYKTLAPIEGIGVIVGANGDALCAPQSTAEAVKSVITFL